MLRRTLTAAGSAPSGTSRCTALPHRRGCSAAARRHRCVLRDARCRRIARRAPVGRSSCAFSTTRRCRSSSAGACSSGRTCGVPTRLPACARVPAHCASARVRSLYGAGRRGSRSTPSTPACRARYALGYYWGDESKRVFFEHQQGNLEKARARATAADIRQPLRQAPHRDHICSGPMPRPSAPRPVACCIGRRWVLLGVRCMLHGVCCCTVSFARCTVFVARCTVAVARCTVAVARCTAGRRGADGRRHARADGEADQGPLPRRLDLRRVEGVQLVRATPAPAPRQSRVARSPHVVRDGARRTARRRCVLGAGLRPPTAFAAERRLGCAGTRASWCT